MHCRQKAIKEKSLFIFIGMMIKTVDANVKIIIFAALCIIALLFSQFVQAQELQIIHNIKVHQQQIASDSNYKMVELKSYVPSLVYDIRYATTNNFTRKQLYQKGNKTFMRKPAATALQQVQKNLAAKGLGLKVWDAYRPYAATKLMWDLIKDERYVANPAKGSGHNRGLAIDVTLIDLNTGEELNMGTGYDNFSDTAHQTFTNLPTDVLQNRQLLKQTMEVAGFVALPTEWWHFYWPNNNNYAVLNLSFNQLWQLSKKQKTKKPKGN